VEIFHTYHIRFTRRGETQARVRQFQASNPGSAFAKCIKKFPGCTLLGGWREARLITGGGEICRLTYAPPSTARIIGEPEPKVEQIAFGFLEEISLNHPKKQECALASPILQPKIAA
jgi:hypothetical protein